MKCLKLLLIGITIIIVCIGCDVGDKPPITTESIVGQWIVSNERVDIKKFTRQYGQIRLNDASVVLHHFQAGMSVEFTPDGTVKFESESGNYLLLNQDGSNYIVISAQVSKSFHPIEMSNNKLIVGPYILIQEKKHIS